jgi:isopenicillin N synthase-like dioxygenase
MLLYTPPKTTRIPVVDLAPSFSGTARGKAAVAEEIHKAARGTGFFYVANHRIDPALTADALAQARRFFDQPYAAKLAVRQTPASPRGYEPLEAQMLDKGSPGDLKEGFSISGDPVPGDTTVTDPTSDFKPSKWPADLPGFRERVLAYYEPMTGLGRHLMRLIALSLDMPEDFFDAAYQWSYPSLRLHRYPPHPEQAAFNQLGAGAHTDWGVITLLAQDQNGGLEVENAAGEWLRAEPIANTFVVNLGDMIARWTNDLYHSNMHRVLNNISGSDRYSMALFYNPRFQTRVECLPTCLPVDGKPNYAPCTAGEHIHAKRVEARAAVGADVPFGARLG